MQRRIFLATFGAGGLGAWLAGCSTATANKVGRLETTRSEWRETLPPERYAILFEAQTERAGTSALLAEQRPGTYICAACYFPLFPAQTKYDSHTGWPSFYRPIADHVATQRDFKLVVPRTEYHCARCGGHQGHRFDDGPEPTGERYCNNGLALRFVREGRALPELRA